MAVVEKGFMSPVRFSSANPTIQVSDGVDTSAVAISLSADTDYWIAGDDDTTANHVDLLKRIEDDINTTMAGWTTPSVLTLTTDGRNIITFAFTTAVDVQWNTGGSFDPTILGFTDADTGSGMSHASPDASKGFWYPGTSTNPRAPFEDDEGEPDGITSIAVAADGSSRGYDISPGPGSDYTRLINYRHIDKAKVKTAHAAADEPYGTVEYNWVNYWRRGVPIRLYVDRSTRAISGWTLWRLSNPGRPWSIQDGPRIKRYNVDLMLREVAT